MSYKTPGKGNYKSRNSDSDDNSSIASGPPPSQNYDRRSTLQKRGLQDEYALVHISGFKSTKRHQSEMHEVAEKLQKAMIDMDTWMMEENDEELLRDFFETITHLESGKLKYQLREFVDRFRNVSSAYKDASQERNQVMESLAEWFLLELEGRCGQVWMGDPDVRNELVDLKLIFQKLDSLAQKIDEYRIHGFSFDHMEIERREAQRRAVGVFTKFTDSRVINMNNEKIFQSDDNINAKVEVIARSWVKQFDEFEGIMNQHKGDSYTAESFKNVIKGFDQVKAKVDETMMNIKQIYEEKKGLEEEITKWKDENMLTADEKSSRQKKINKLKHDYRESLYELERYQVVKIPEYLAVDNDAITEGEHYEKEKREDLANPARPIKHEADKHAKPDKDSTVLQKMLDSARHEIQESRKNYKEELEALAKDLSELRHHLKEQTDTITDLKRQKTSLLEQLQMKLTKDHSIPLTERRQSDASNISGNMFKKLTGLAHGNTHGHPPALADTGRRATINENFPDQLGPDAPVKSKKGRSKEDVHRETAVLQEAIDDCKRQLMDVTLKKNAQVEQLRIRNETLEKQIHQRERDNREMKLRVQSLETRLRHLDQERRMTVPSKSKHAAHGGMVQSTVKAINFGEELDQHQQEALQVQPPTATPTPGPHGRRASIQPKRHY